MKKIKFLKLKKTLIKFSITSISIFSIATLNYFKVHATSFKDVKLEESYYCHSDILKQICYDQNFQNKDDQKIDKKDFENLLEETKKSKHDAKYFHVAKDLSKINELKMKYCLQERNKVTVTKKEQYTNDEYSFYLEVDEFEPIFSSKNNNRKEIIKERINNIDYDRPRKGDLITHVNGRAVSSLGDFDLEGILQELKYSQSLEINFLRPSNNGEPKAMKYKSDLSKQIHMRCDLYNHFIDEKDLSKLTEKNNAFLLAFKIRFLDFDVVEKIKQELNKYMNKNEQRRILTISINFDGCIGGNFYAARKLAGFFLPKNEPFMQIKNIYNDNICTLKNSETQIVKRNLNIPIAIYIPENACKAVKLLAMILKKHTNTALFGSSIDCDQLEPKFFDVYDNGKKVDNMLVCFPKIAYRVGKKEEFDKDEFDTVKSTIKVDYETKFFSQVRDFLIENMNHLLLNKGVVRSNEEKKKAFEKCTPEELKNCSNLNQQNMKNATNDKILKKNIHNTLFQKLTLNQTEKYCNDIKNELKNHNTEDLLLLDDENRPFAQSSHLFSILATKAVAEKIIAEKSNQFNITLDNGEKLNIKKFFSDEELKCIEQIYSKIDINQAMKTYNEKNKYIKNSNTVNLNKLESFMFDPTIYYSNQLDSLKNGSDKFRRSDSFDDIAQSSENRVRIDRAIDFSLQKNRENLNQSKKSILTSFWEDF